MSDITLRPLAGTVLAPPPVRTAPPEPAAVQQAVGQPINSPQAAVNQSPATSGAEHQQNTDPDGQRQNSPAKIPLSSQQLAKTLDRVNQRLLDYNTKIQFDIDTKHGGKVVVRIIDQETKEVIKQIPPEKALEFAAFFDELEAQNSQVSSESPQKKPAADGPRLKLDGLLFSDKA